MSSNKLYILYNADATVMGKLKYGYRKITCPKDGDPACAACEITHGGLSLRESPEWVAAKKEIKNESNLEIIQWHRDEVSPELKAFIKEKNVRYPAIITERDNEGFEVGLDGDALVACKGDPKAFFQELKRRNIIGGVEQSSSL